MAIFNKKRLIVALLAMAGLLVSTHMRVPQLHILDSLNSFELDKVLHLLAYGVLTCLVIIAIKPPRRLIMKLGILGALVLLAIADESTQGFVGRSTSSMDLVADMIGMFTAMVLSFSWPYKDAVGNSGP